MKLTLREPEAIFWIFVFPILLAVGLGIAFRNRQPDVLPVGATTAQLAQELAADKGLKATEMDEGAGGMRWRGRIVLLPMQGPDGVVYRYDDTNPDARTARMIGGPGHTDCGGTARCGDGRKTTWCTKSARDTSTLWCPGLLGMNVMGSAMWGLGFSIVDARQKKLLKRMVASPMPRWQYLAGYLLSRMVHAGRLRRQYFWALRGLHLACHFAGRSGSLRWCAC